MAHRLCFPTFLCQFFSSLQPPYDHHGTNIEPLMICLETSAKTAIVPQKTVVSMPARARLLSIAQFKHGIRARLWPIGYFSGIPSSHPCVINRATAASTILVHCAPVATTSASLPSLPPVPNSPSRPVPASVTSLAVSPLASASTILLQKFLTGIRLLLPNEPSRL
ncbi:hypothetical protein U1Q18_031793 [Sarracenia purpurea var. burkii]